MSKIKVYNMKFSLSEMREKLDPNVHHLQLILDY
jgi:hypothetical protein